MNDPFTVTLLDAITMIVNKTMILKIYFQHFIYYALTLKTFVSLHLKMRK